MTPTSTATRGMWGLVGIFTASGVLHLARPRIFEAIVPNRLPAKREIVYASGALELACAAGMAVPATRRIAGLLSAGLLVVVFPANLQMAADALKGHSRATAVVAVGRLPLQLPMIRTALRTFRPHPR